MRKVSIEGPKWIPIKRLKMDMKSNTSPSPKLPLKQSRTPPQPNTSSKNKARKRSYTKAKRKDFKIIYKEGRTQRKNKMQLDKMTSPEAS